MAADGPPEIRSKHVNARFTPTEFAEIEQARGRRNRSDIARRLLLRWARGVNRGEDDALERGRSDRG